MRSDLLHSTPGLLFPWTRALDSRSRTLRRQRAVLRLARGGQKPRFDNAASPAYMWIRPLSRSPRRTSGEFISTEASSLPRAAQWRKRTRDLVRAVGGMPLSRLPDPTNVARYVRDRDQQRWRRCVGSNPLAPTIRVGPYLPKVSFIAFSTSSFKRLYSSASNSGRSPRKSFTQ